MILDRFLESFSAMTLAFGVVLVFTVFVERGSPPFLGAVPLPELDGHDPVERRHVLNRASRALFGSWRFLFLVLPASFALSAANTLPKVLEDLGLLSKRTSAFDSRFLITLAVALVGMCWQRGITRALVRSQLAKDGFVVTSKGI